MSDSSIDYKVVLIGNSGVGKTSLFKKITTGQFSEKNISTIGMDKKTLNLEIEVNQDNQIVKKEVNVSLVDTAGEERFRSITKNYFKESDGILLLYDVTNKETFKNVEGWIDSIHECLGNHNNSKYLIFLIGNKTDLIGVDDYQRDVQEEEGRTKCEEKSLVWGGETSVKNIELTELKDLFKDYVKKIYDKVGEKIVTKQVTKKMDSYKKKRKSILCF
jgi:small GTP-binding protein